MKKLDPQALSAEDLAKLLTKAGGRRVTAKDVEADRQLGAPTNGDGTFHVVHFTAWLVTATSPAA